MALAKTSSSALGLIDGHAHGLFHQADLLDDAGTLVEEGDDAAVDHVDAERQSASAFWASFPSCAATWNPC